MGSAASELARMSPRGKDNGSGGKSRMEAEGVELIGRVLGAFGVTEAISHVKDLRATFKKIVRLTDEVRPRRPS